MMILAANLAINLFGITSILGQNFLEPIFYSLAIGVTFAWLHHLRSTLDDCNTKPQTISEVELLETKFAKLNIKGDSSNFLIV